MALIKRHFLVVLIGAVLSGCASGKPQRDGQASIAAIDPQQTVESIATEEPEKVPLLDRTQQTVYGVTSGAAQKVDNFFGSADVEEEATVSRGRLSVGGQWDERNSLKKRARLKARVALPAIGEAHQLVIRPRRSGRSGGWVR